MGYVILSQICGFLDLKNQNCPSYVHAISIRLIFFVILCSIVIICAELSRVTVSSWKYWDSAWENETERQPGRRKGRQRPPGSIKKRKGLPDWEKDRFKANKRQAAMPGWESQFSFDYITFSFPDPLDWHPCQSKMLLSYLVCLHQKTDQKGLLDNKEHHTEKTDRDTLTRAVGRENFYCCCFTDITCHTSIRYQFHSNQSQNSEATQKLGTIPRLP